MQQLVRCDSWNSCGITNCVKHDVHNRVPACDTRIYCHHVESHIRCNPVEEPAHAEALRAKTYHGEPHGVAFAGKAREVFAFLAALTDQDWADIVDGDIGLEAHNTRLADARAHHWPGHWGEAGTCPICQAEGPDPDAKRKAEAEEIMRDDRAEMTEKKVRRILEGLVLHYAPSWPGCHPDVKAATARIMALKRGE
jgi:hypothetical protein